MSLHTYSCRKNYSLIYIKPHFLKDLKGKLQLLAGEPEVTGNKTCVYDYGYKTHYIHFSHSLQVVFRAVQSYTEFAEVADS